MWVAARLLGKSGRLKSGGEEYLVTHLAIKTSVSFHALAQTQHFAPQKADTAVDGLHVLLAPTVPLPCCCSQGDNEPARVEVEQQKYLSALPFLPAISEKTLKTYYTFYAAFFGAVIMFGGLLAPLLEVRIGLGGEPRLHWQHGCGAGVVQDCSPAGDVTGQVHAAGG